MERENLKVRVRVLVGDLFESKAQTWVNTVNCRGVMGKGIALEFKKRFPDMFADYQERCRRGEVVLGKPYLYRREEPPWILNFPTKDDWRSVAKLDAIIEGLKYLIEHYRKWGITSLAVPPLGCGQGQLEWRIVGPTLYRYLSQLEIPVELYAPYGTPHEELQPAFLDQPALNLEEPRMPEPKWVKPEWVALVEILKRIESQPYHYPIGHTSFQKLVYVATEEGLDTGLEFRRGSYGPFAEGLKRLIATLQNHGLIREEKFGKMIRVRVGSTYEDARKAYAEQLERYEAIIDKTTDLFMRLNTERAEIVATVLFVTKDLAREKSSPPTETEVLNAVLRWKQRRRPPLSEEQVALAIRQLAALGWLEVLPDENLPLPDVLEAIV